MDLDGFREPQSPWFFSQPPTYLVEARVNRVVADKKDTAPTQDARFPGYAAPMDDGRLVTDYRTHCAVNIPTGQQFASRKFMQRNGEAIIMESRRRQASRAGAGMAFDSRTDVPAQLTVHCDAQSCGYRPNVAKGVGVERREPTPFLFGTFAMSRPSWGIPAEPPLTMREEGGRNSVRGLF
jgi:hypothetical protein